MSKVGEPKVRSRLTDSLKLTVKYWVEVSPKKLLFRLTELAKATLEMLGLLEPVHLDRGLLDRLEQTIQMAVGVERQKLGGQMAMGKVEMAWLLL